LYYYYPTDTAAAHIGNQFFWGEDIMVAPILEKGITSRQVYLPNGVWYLYNHHMPIEGSSYITSATSLSGIPVYVKAGSIIPTEEADSAKNTSSLTGKKINLHYYCHNGKSEGKLFIDDGKDANSLANGFFKVIQIQAKGNNNSFAFEIKTSGGKLAREHLPETLQFTLHGIGKPPTQLLLNGKALATPVINNSINGATEVVFTVPYSTNTFTISVK
jgi:oligosaccharide 4-alpha-D-glucosyltransferase